MNVWDHASGVLCCEEAGAIVTDGFGNTLKLRKESRQTEEVSDERKDVDLRRTFSPKGKAIVVANEESLHKEILRAHNAGVEKINDFSAGLGR
jgi:fructose-1,6-bisphosphatase/inositol monophosphatase family enzyme